MKRISSHISVMFFLPLMVIVSNPAIAQSTHGASIVFERQTIDLDSVIQGSKCTAIFNYKNNGDSHLIIFDAKTSCGCTIPSWSKAPLAPGDSLNIKVQYNTSTLGAFRKTILVKSNAKNKPKSILQIKGVVVKNKKR